MVQLRVVDHLRTTIFVHLDVDELGISHGGRANKEVDRVTLELNVLELAVDQAAIIETAQDRVPKVHVVKRATRGFCDFDFAAAGSVKRAFGDISQHTIDELRAAKVATYR